MSRWITEQVRPLQTSLTESWREQAACTSADPDLFYDGTPVHIGDVEIRAHHTPGHCPGEVCLEVREQGARETHLFVGDSLFAGSIGRTDLPGGNYEVLMQSITKVIMGFGDDAIVHPGHGPDTTVRRERTRNPFVLEYLSGRARS